MLYVIKVQGIINVSRLRSPSSDPGSWLQRDILISAYLGAVVEFWCHVS